MAYRTGKNAPLGVPQFGVPHDNRATNVGDVTKGWDEVLGEGEFIFLPGVAGCLSGDLVLYDLAPGTEATVRATAANAANSGRSVAVAICDCGAGQFAWFQKRGLTVANAIAGTAVGLPFVSATAGQVTSVDAAGAELVGARITSAVGTPAAGKVYMTLDTPAIEVA